MGRALADVYAKNAITCSLICVCELRQGKSSAFHEIELISSFSYQILRFCICILKLLNKGGMAKNVILFLYFFFFRPVFAATRHYQKEISKLEGFKQ